MKPTTDKVFLDTNVLVYCYSNSELNKQEIARKLIADNNTFISTQVIQELCNIVTRKFNFPYSTAEALIRESRENNNLYINSDDTILHACSIAATYKFSFYDSLIIAAALESGCTTLYSEDLHDGQQIESKLIIRNPFK